MKSWSRIVTVVLFAIGMAYLEAMVVVYIREILNIVPPPVNLDVQFFQQMMRHHPELIWREQTREAATIIMLVTLALLTERDWRRRVGVFLLAFGVWDLFYYFWLVVLIGWPPSLMTRDVLFLIPVPWIAPVVLPVTLAFCMSVAGIKLLLTPSERLQRL